MSLNKAKGNMFKFVDATYNPLAGKCPHNCGYCYADKGFFKDIPKYQGGPRLHKDSLHDDLNRYDVYFVANMADMFAEEVNRETIIEILDYCSKFNRGYLFLTKNPERYKDFLDKIPRKSILGTTLETNKEYRDTNAPSIKDRAYSFYQVDHPYKMVSIEPIMDFTFSGFHKILKDWIEPEFVAIGADSKDCGLNEPSKNQTINLIERLKKHTQVHLKKNLSRIIGKKKRKELHEEVGQSGRWFDV